MENLTISKFIKMENGCTANLNLFVCNNTFSTEKVIVEINELNGKPISYVYSTVIDINADEDRYIKVIPEALEELRQNKNLKKLLDWDGKLKYKVSL